MLADRIEEAGKKDALEECQDWINHSRGLVMQWMNIGL